MITRRSIGIVWKLNDNALVKNVRAGMVLGDVSTVKTIRFGWRDRAGNAVAEMEEKTLVYLAVDTRGKYSKMSFPYAWGHCCIGVCRREPNGESRVAG